MTAHDHNPATQSFNGSNARPFQRVDGDGHDVVFHAADREAVVIGAQAALLACDMHNERSARSENTKQDMIEMMQQAISWCSKQPSVVRAFLSAQPRHLCLQFLTVGEWHDCELDDPMTDLDLHLSARFPDIPLELESIPARLSTPETEAGKLQFYAKP